MKRLLLGLAQVCLLSAGQPITPEWVLGPEAKALTAMPRTAWLPDGSLLLQDLRRAPKDRSLERLDPSTGGRRPALDASKALASLRALVGPDGPESVPWPQELDDQGRRGVVKVGEAFFLLDFPSSTFRALPAAECLALAPDGLRIAYVKDHDLHVLDLASGTDRRITQDGAATILNGTFSWVYGEEIFDHREAALWWSPDSRTVAFLRTDESQVPVHGFTDFQPYQARLLQQRYPQAGQPNPAVRLGLVAAAAGTVAWMDLPAASYEYLVRVTWLPAGDRVAVQTLNRAQDTLDLNLVDAATGASRRILREHDDAWVHFYEPCFLKDGKHFLWASDRGGYNHLYRYTVAGELVNAVTRGDWSLTPWGMYAGGRTGLAGVDEKGGWVYFTSQASGVQERQLWKVRLDGTGMVRLSAEEGHHAADFSPDFRFYVDRWSSVSRPPAAALRKADGTLSRMLAEARTDLGISTPRLQTIPAADGQPLPAWVLGPAEPDPAKRHPVIFYVYGGPGSPSALDRWSNGLLWDQLLLAEGYVVVTVDNRSSAGIGQRFETPIKGRMYGEVEIQDLAAAVKWVKAQPWADPERLGVWGWSGGGTYTLAALTHLQDFRAGIAVAPVTDWRYYDSVYTEMAMKLPADNPDGYRATSLVACAKDLHGRLLLVHGTHDDNVHPQNSQAFADELIAAGKLFDCMVYPMRQHGISDKPATLHLYRTMLEFWKRNL